MSFALPLSRSDATPLLSRTAAAPLTQTILPHELPQALAGFPAVRVLSLDCFDTLLWRDSYAPRDVFAALPGITPLQRAGAETLARRIARARDGRDEVSIAEIHACLHPGAPAAVQAAAVAAELAAEQRHAFAFAPTVALMRAAKARGLAVVVVSDTYFDAAQLRALIAGAAGEEVAGLIDRIFTSCAFGRPKADGLYAEVLRRLAVPASAILHIGDNLAADGDGVALHGVHTLHLRQFTTETEQRLRLEAGMAAMIHRATPAKLTHPQPHRAALALIEPQLTDPAERLGATVLGPLFAGFERWLQAEAAALAASLPTPGHRVHWLFVMRDGWLPRLVHAEASGEDGHAIEISRFTATAASLATPRDVAAHVEREYGTMPDAVARQLLIPEDEIAELLAGRTPEAAALELLRQSRHPQRQQAVLRATRALARRLVAHIRATVAPAPGDTLMLVDLGYNGTVQNRIGALLAKALKVHVAGRYLLLRETDRPGLDKRGFIDSEHFAAPVLEALCANVAVVEQLATRAIGSVVDYTDAGAPIRRANDISHGQSTVREAVQAGCLRFVREYGRAAIRRDPGDEMLWREGATAALARLMYLPLPAELAVIRAFDHDINLGSARTVALFDPAVGAVGLRRRGLFYMKQAPRMYLPAEIADAPLGDRLHLFLHQRFTLPFGFADFGSGPALPVIHLDATSGTPSDIATTATQDGWFLAAIPIGPCRYTTAIRFGARFAWVQIDRIEAVPVSQFLTADDADTPLPVASVLDGMVEVEPGLYHCAAEDGIMLIPPPAVAAKEAMMLAVVFRPLVGREGI